MRSFTRSGRYVLGFLAAAFGAGTAGAHDFWIEPSSFRPGLDARLTVDLRVGEAFAGEAVKRDPDRIERFVLVGANGLEEAIVGFDGEAPAGYLRPSAAGAQWIAYQSKPASLVLEAAKFESYLAEEGLEAIVDARRARGETSRPGRERYSRCAKAFLRVGETPSAGFDQRLGLPLEILLEKDPASMKPGDELSVRVLWLGKPLPGLLLGALAKGGEAEARARTDAEGRARLAVGRDGAWLLHGVHMVRAEAGREWDWESHWASLTFELE